MSFFKFLFSRVPTIFLAVAAAWGLLVYWLFPLFGIEVTHRYSTGFMLQALFLFVSVFILIYFIFKKYYRRNVAERNATEQLIKRYEAISDATNDAIWDHNLETGNTYYNKRMKDVYGYSDADMKNNPTWWIENVHVNDRQRVKKRMDTILENGENFWSDEYKFKCKNGEYKIVFDRGLILRDASNKPQRLIGAMIDVTEARNLQQQIFEKRIRHKEHLGRAIMQAHEEEKKRIKDELHEDVNQVLAAIKIFIHHANGRVGQNKVLLESEQQLDEAMVKIKRISNALMPTGMQYFGLVSSVNDLFSSIENPQRQIDFYHVDFDESRLLEPVKLVLFRVIQEYADSLLKENSFSVRLEMMNNGNKVQVYFTEPLSTLSPEEFLKKRNLYNQQSKIELYNGTLRHVQSEVNQVCVEIDL